MTSAWQSLERPGRDPRGPGIYAGPESRLRPITGPTDRGGLSWGDGLRAFKNVALTGLDVLDTPRAAVVSTLKEGRDLAAGRGFSPADWFRQTRDNITVREAFGDPTNNRVANIALGVLMDSAADPFFLMGGAGAAAFAAGGSRSLARVAAADTISGTTTLRSALRFGELTGDTTAAQYMRALGEAPDDELAAAAARYAQESGLADEVNAALVTMVERGGGVGAVRASQRFRGRSDELVESLAGPGVSGVRLRPVWQASGGPQIISQDAWAQINAPFRAARGAVAGSRPFRAIADRNPFGSSEWDQAMTKLIDSTVGMPPALRVARIRQAGLRKTIVPTAMARLAQLQTDADTVMSRLTDEQLEAMRVAVQTPARDRGDARYLEAMNTLADAGEAPDRIRRVMADSHKLLSDHGVDVGHIPETFFPMRREGGSAAQRRRAGMDYSRTPPLEIGGRPLASVAREIELGTMRAQLDGTAVAVAGSRGGANWDAIDTEIAAAMRGADTEWTSPWMAPREALNAYWLNITDTLRAGAELSAARAAGTAAWTGDMSDVLDVSEMVAALNTPTVAPLAAEASESLHRVADAATRWAVHQQRRLEAGAGAARLVDADTARLWDRMPAEARERVTALMAAAPDRQPAVMRRVWAEFDAANAGDAAAVADDMLAALNSLERVAERLARVQAPDAQRTAAALRGFIADQSNPAARMAATEAVEKIRAAARVSPDSDTAAVAVQAADDALAEGVSAVAAEAAQAARFAAGEGLPAAVAAERFADAKALWTRIGDRYEGLRGPPDFATDGLPAAAAAMVERTAEVLHASAQRIGARLMAEAAAQQPDPRLAKAMARIAAARDPSSRASRQWQQLRDAHPHLARLHTNSLSQAFAGVSDAPKRAAWLVSEADGHRRLGHRRIADSLETAARELRDAVDTAETWSQLSRAMTTAGFRADELDTAAAQLTQIVNAKIASAHLTEATGVGPVLTASEGAGLKAQFDAAVRAAAGAARKVEKHDRLQAALAAQAGIVWREHHGWAVPADMAEALDAVVNRPRLGEFARTLETLSSWLRGHLTLSVGFHVRNYVGGAWNNWIAHNVGVRDYQRFWSEYMRFKQSLAPADREMRQAVERLAALGALGQGQFADDIALAAPDAMTRSWGNPLAGLRDPNRQWAAVEANRRAGSTVEDLLRGALGAKVLLNSKHLGDEAALVAAAQQITRWHFDYRALSTMDRYAKNVAPFWIWYSRNMALQWQLMGANPGMAVTAERLFEAVGDGHPVNPFTPGWYFDQRWVQLGQNTWLTVDLPNTAMHRVMWSPAGAPSGEVAAPVLSMVNPIIKAPLEQLSSQDFMRGYPIVDAEDRLRRVAEQLFPSVFRVMNLAAGDREKRLSRAASFTGVPISVVSRQDMIREATFGERWRAPRTPAPARTQAERDRASQQRIDDLIEQGMRMGRAAAR